MSASVTDNFFAATEKNEHHRKLGGIKLWQKFKNGDNKFLLISNFNLEPPMKWSILDHFCTGANIGSANGQMSNYYLH